MTRCPMQTAKTCVEALVRATLIRKGIKQHYANFCNWTAAHDPSEDVEWWKCRFQGAFMVILAREQRHFLSRETSASVGRTGLRRAGGSRITGASSRCALAIIRIAAGGT